MAAIEACRTAALGGHVEQCEQCRETRVAYNSCRNRHCPKCQGLARLQWLADRRAELLPVPYFHLVFTLPAPVAAIALANKAVVYDILFKAAAETIRTIGADPKHLGAETGMIAILHTWGQTLTHHPHVHCIVPGGGLGSDGSFIPCRRPGFFLPVRVLSHLYRRLFLDRLAAAFEAGNLTLCGDLARLRDASAFGAQIKALRSLPWVVYAKRPFGGPERVLDYLGRYTHRVAIANGRLLACENGRVRFRCCSRAAASTNALAAAAAWSTSVIRWRPIALVHARPPDATAHDVRPKPASPPVPDQVGRRPPRRRSTERARRCPGAHHRAPRPHATVRAWNHGPHARLDPRRMRPDRPAQFRPEPAPNRPLPHRTSIAANPDAASFNPASNGSRQSTQALVAPGSI